MPLIKNKPVALLVTVAPALAAVTVVFAIKLGLSWYVAFGLFYASLAMAELLYLMVVIGDRPLAERGARSVAGERGRRVNPYS